MFSSGSETDPPKRISKGRGKSSAKRLSTADPRNREKRSDDKEKNKKKKGKEDDNDESDEEKEKKKKVSGYKYIINTHKNHKQLCTFVMCNVHSVTFSLYIECRTTSRYCRRPTSFILTQSKEKGNSLIMKYTLITERNSHSKIIH